MTLFNTLPAGDVIANFLPHKAVYKALNVLILSLVAYLISGCAKQPEVTGIQVEIWHQGAPVSCETFERAQQQWLIRQLAFFVSELTFYSQGTSLKPQLASSPWQTSGLALVKPQLSNCDQPSKEVVDHAKHANDRLTFDQPINVEDIQALSFSLAVPFALNHQNPLLQPSPLNMPSMFWSWRSGHKFFRIDLEAENKNWVFHLGSVGCESASAMRGPSKECVQPNRLTFELTKLHQGTKLILHLDRLLQDTRLTSRQSCLFHGGQDSCQTLLENLQHQDVFEWH